MSDVSIARRVRPLIAVLPRAVQEHLFTELPSDARKLLGIEVTVSLLGESGISLLPLFKSARVALEGGGDQNIPTATGRELTVRASGVEVHLISRTADGETAARLMPLSLLTEDRVARNASFEELVLALHGALEGLEEWRRTVDSGALSDDQMLKLFDAVNDAPVTAWSRLRSRAAKRRLGVDDLVPTAQAYYCAVLGDMPNALQSDTYLSDTWPRIVERLLRGNPTSGARLLLPLAVDPAFYLSSFMRGVDEESKQQLLSTPRKSLDLGSRLGLLDIACAELRTSQEVGRANELVPTPSDEGFAIEGRLVVALAEISYARLLEAENLIDVPDYWRRMCAWWNAGHVARILQEEGIEAEGFVEWLEGVLDAGCAAHSIIRLARAPGAAWSRPKAFVAEPFVFGRIAALLSRKEFDLEDARALAAAALNRRDELIREGHPCEAFVPGPIIVLGAHAIRATQDVDAENCEKIEQLLVAGEVDEWRRLGYMSQCLEFPERLRIALGKSIDRSQLPMKSESRKEFFDSLLEAGLVAARLRDAQLAGAVLGRCRVLLAGRVSSGEARELVVTGFFAAAFEESEDAWLNGYGKFLRFAASTIGDPTSLDDIGEFVAEIARLLPSKSRRFSQAQAILSLVHGMTW